MKKRIHIILLFAAIALSACSDWYDVSARSEADGDKLFSGEEGYFSALAGVYQKMADRKLYGSAMTVSNLELMSSTHTFHTYGPFVDEYPMWYEAFDFCTYRYKRGDRLETVENAIKGIWTTAYNAIANVNELIERLEVADPEIFEDGVRDLMLGEALAIRAYLHFDMARLFQPPYLSEKGRSEKRIPYTDKFGMEFTPSYSTDEILDLVEAELERAAGLMKSLDPISSGSSYTTFMFSRNRQFKMNYYAVKALQARVWQYRSKNREAYAAAMEIIEAAEDKGIRFISSEDLDRKDSAGKPVARSCPMENVFGLLVPTLGETVKTNYTSGMGSVFQTRFRLQAVRFPSWFSSAGDIRRAIWAKDSGANLAFSKYDRPVSAADLALYPDEAVAMIRIGELYLIASEAALDAVSEDEALRLLNILQSKRGGGVFSGAGMDGILKEIMREYRRELIGEGQLFFMYKRLNAPEIEKGYTSSGMNAMDMERYTPDIPEDEYNGGRTY